MIRREVLLLAFTCFIASSKAIEANTLDVSSEATIDEHKQKKHKDNLPLMAQVQDMLKSNSCPYGSEPFDDWVDLTYEIDVVGEKPHCSPKEYEMLPVEIEKALNILGSSLSVEDTQNHYPVEFRVGICEGESANVANRLLRGLLGTSRNLCSGCWPYTGGGGGGCQACGGECDDDTASDDPNCNGRRQRELFATAAQLTPADYAQFEPVKTAVELSAEKELEKVLPTVLPCLKGKELAVAISVDMVPFSGVGKCARK